MRALAERVRDVFSSVRVRVTASAVLLIAIGLTVAAVAVSTLVHRSLSSDYDSLLADRVDEVELLARDGTLRSEIAATDRETGQLQVIDASRAVVAASTGMAQSSRFDVIDPPAMGRQIEATVDGAELGATRGEQFRVLARTVPSAGGALTIYGVTSLRAAQQAEHHLRRLLGIGMALLALLAAVLIWWVVGRALAPVDAMREVVDRIEASDLDDRIATSKRNDEIGRLGATLNRMLARLQEGSNSQRLFAAAASHELRSPLSAIRTELEVGLTYPDRTDWKLVANESLVEVERLERLARDLTQLTRIHANAVTQPTGPCDLRALVEAELARRGTPLGVVHRTELRPATVAAPKDSVVWILRNLLDNAERHASSEIVVTTATSSDPPVVRLAVANDGPPIAESDRERIFAPFTRLDDARDLDEGGSGLGLAIARGLAESLGGTLTVVDVASGAEFAATFPVVGRD